MSASRGMMWDGSADYGLGMFIYGDCTGAAGHAGTIDGFQSFALHRPETDRTVIAFVNTTSPTGVAAAAKFAFDALCYS